MQGNLNEDFCKSLGSVPSHAEQAFAAGERKAEGLFRIWRDGVTINNKLRGALLSSQEARSESGDVSSAVVTD